MPILTRADLWSLEQYSLERKDFRAKVMAHKKPRKIMLGGHLLLIFEDKLTVQYQIQEMLRIEKIFEADGIQDELNAYNPLIPDGDNWKCSLLIQYVDVSERGRQLKALVGIEEAIWIQIDENAPIYAIADEDMVRDNSDKTSAVHFMRYQLQAEDVIKLRAGADIKMGVNHSNYACEPQILCDASRAALLADLGSD